MNDHDATAATTMATPDPTKSVEQMVALVVMVVAQLYLIVDPQGLSGVQQAAMQTTVLTVWTIFSLVHAAVVRKGRAPIAVAQIEQNGSLSAIKQNVQRVQAQLEGAPAFDPGSRIFVGDPAEYPHSHEVQAQIDRSVEDMVKVTEQRYAGQDPDVNDDDPDEEDGLYQLPDEGEHEHEGDCCSPEVLAELDRIDRGET